METIVASETSFSNPALPTISIDVYVKYQNRVAKANTYVFPYSPEDAENPELIL